MDEFGMNFHLPFLSIKKDDISRYVFHMFAGCEFTAKNGWILRHVFHMFVGCKFCWNLNSEELSWRWKTWSRREYKTIKTAIIAQCWWVLRWSRPSWEKPKSWAMRWLRQCDGARERQLSIGNQYKHVSMAKSCDGWSSGHYSGTTWHYSTATCWRWFLRFLGVAWNLVGRKNEGSRANDKLKINITPWLV